MKLGRAFRALVALAAGAVSLPLLPLGCGESASCVPGQSIACSRGTCNGHQVCEADGKSYGECQCNAAGSGSFPKTGPNSGLIGAACESEEHCRQGLDCLTSTSRLIDGQGPSAGICLARCIPEHDFCQELDARSKCIVLSDSGTPGEELDDAAYCLPGCELGTQPNDLDKCRSRLDLVCTEAVAGSGVGYCRPACRSDLDCGDRFCDLATGLCGDVRFTGDPIGAECDPNASNRTCGGGCIEHGGGYAECSGACRFDTPSCGQSGGDLPLDFYCYLDPAAGTGEGDLGYCARACDCDDNCDREDAVCQPEPELAAKTGRPGVCGSKLFPSGAARPNTPCPR